MQQMMKVLWKLRDSSRVVVKGVGLGLKGCFYWVWKESVKQMGIFFIVISLHSFFFRVAICVIP